MAEPVRGRRLSDEESRRLPEIVRRGTGSPIRLRRAMVITASASGNTVQAIARLVQGDDDAMRKVIHRFNEARPAWTLGGRMAVPAGSVKTTQGRKTDDTDAHFIALVGVRTAGLCRVFNDETLGVLRLLVDRRRRIGEDHTRTDPRRRQEGPVRRAGSPVAGNRSAEGPARTQPTTPTQKALDDTEGSRMRTP